MRKSVSVTIVKDEDVVQHILPVADKEGAKSGKTESIHISATQSIQSKKKKANPDDIENMECRMGDEQDLCLPQFSALHIKDSSRGIGGKDVFPFCTPKRSGQLATKGTLSSLTSILWRGKRKTESDTLTETLLADQPLSSSSCELKTNQNLLPVSKPVSSRPKQTSQTTTPYRLRKRNAVEQSSDEDSLEESTTSEEEDESEGNEFKDGGFRKPIKLIANPEEYFDLHSSTPATSNRTLSRLALPQMDVGVVREAIQSYVGTHIQQRKHLYDKHCMNFRTWMFQMCYGFNILLHGFGSKHYLLEEFRKQYLTDFSHVVINGYFPSLSVKQILNCITTEICQTDESWKIATTQVEFIGSWMDKNDTDIYLVIHNIDGTRLHAEKTQNILSQLAAMPRLHMIASIDHINAPLLWDQTKCSRFKWVYYDVTTYSPYLAETSYENSLLVQQSGTLVLGSLSRVLQSLTSNAQKIFQLLAQYQLDNAECSSYIGMSFQDLYIRCRESFLVNTDQTLRAQLVEFRDHKLIFFKKNFDGVEYLTIPVESLALKEFLEQE